MIAENYPPQTRLARESLAAGLFSVHGTSAGFRAFLPVLNWFMNILASRSYHVWRHPFTGGDVLTVWCLCAFPVILNHNFINRDDIEWKEADRQKSAKNEEAGVHRQHNLGQKWCTGQPVSACSCCY